MKITPTLEECKNIAAEGSYGVIPISTELYADMTTPIEVLRILKKVSGHVYLLESAETDKRWGRYSFLGYDPLLEITCYNGTTTIKSELTSRTDLGDGENGNGYCCNYLSKRKLIRLLRYSLGMYLSMRERGGANMKVEAPKEVPMVRTDKAR